MIFLFSFYFGKRKKVRGVGEGFPLWNIPLESMEPQWKALKQWKQESFGYAVYVTDDLLIFKWFIGKLNFIKKKDYNQVHWMCT